MKRVITSASVFPNNGDISNMVEAIQHCKGDRSEFVMLGKLTKIIDDKKSAWLFGVLECAEQLGRDWEGLEYIYDYLLSSTSEETMQAISDAKTTLRNQ
jgi:hypothetical protein